MNDALDESFRRTKRWAHLVALALVPVSGCVALLAWNASRSPLAICVGWPVSYFFLADVLAVLAMFGGFCLAYCEPDASYPGEWIRFGVLLGMIGLRGLAVISLLAGALVVIGII